MKLGCGCCEKHKEIGFLAFKVERYTSPTEFKVIDVCLPCFNPMHDFVLEYYNTDVPVQEMMQKLEPSLNGDDDGYVARNLKTYLEIISISYEDFLKSQSDARGRLPKYMERIFSRHFSFMHVPMEKEKDDEQAETFPGSKVKKPRLM